MGIKIQYCMKDNGNTDRNIQKCTKDGCDGVLYYPEVSKSDIKRRMDTFYAMCSCTECDEYTSRDNTAPRYLRWRLVLQK